MLIVDFTYPKNLEPVRPNIKLLIVKIIQWLNLEKAGLNLESRAFFLNLHKNRDGLFLVLLATTYAYSNMFALE